MKNMVIISLKYEINDYGNMLRKNMMQNRGKSSKNFVLIAEHYIKYVFMIE